MHSLENVKYLAYKNKNLALGWAMDAQEVKEKGELTVGLPVRLWFEKANVLTG